MSAVDTRAVTPFVFQSLRTTITEMPKGDRPSYAATALVLTHLARWAKHGGVANDAVSQIESATLVPARMVRRALGALEQAGITESVQRGGGRNRLGTRRVLWLDYHDDGRLVRAVTADESRPETPTVQTVRDGQGNSDRPHGTSSDRNSDRESPNSDRMASNSDRPDGQLQEASIENIHVRPPTDEEKRRSIEALKAGMKEELGDKIPNWFQQRIGAAS